MRRHALNRITHRPERPQRSRIDTERHRLAAAQPAADVCPAIRRARSQPLGTARGKGAPGCPLYRPASLGRRARPFAQIRVVCPFHWRFETRANPARTRSRRELLRFEAYRLDSGSGARLRVGTAPDYPIARLDAARRNDDARHVATTDTLIRDEALACSGWRYAQQLAHVAPTT